MAIEIDDIQFSKLAATHIIVGALIDSLADWLKKANGPMHPFTGLELHEAKQLFIGIASTDLANDMFGEIISSFINAEYGSDDAMLEKNGPLVQGILANLVVETGVMLGAEDAARQAVADGLNEWEKGQG